MTNYIIQMPITKSDILRGRPCMAGSCPYALAIRRALPDYSAFICPESLQLFPLALSDCKFHLNDRYRVSPRVAARLAQFDATGIMLPHTITLTLPFRPARIGKGVSITPIEVPDRALHAQKDPQPALEALPDNPTV